MKGTLILLPNLLHEEGEVEEHLPQAVQEHVGHLDGLIAESEKGGRKYLMRFNFPANRSFSDVPICLLNEHSSEADVQEILEKIKQGGTYGLISDCGMPCLADPGARIVNRARKNNIDVKVYPGPSAIIFALMLSGLSAQAFSFNGYLPRKSEHIRPAILEMEKRSSHFNQTQVCIEAPYRSKQLLQFLISYLNPETTLSVSWNITMPEQGVETKTIREWRHSPLPNLHKTPCVFVFSSPRAARNDFKNKKKKKGMIYDSRKRIRRLEMVK